MPSEWRSFARTGARISALLLCMALSMASRCGGPATFTTVTFQEGVAGYAGTEDLHLSIPEDFTGNGHKESEFATDPDNPHWVWDAEDTWGQGSVINPSNAMRFGIGDDVGLIRFRDIFGDGSGQIPPGAEISSATLTLYPENPILISGEAANVHLALVDWDESARWDDFGAVSGPDIGSDYDHEIEANTGLTTRDVPVAIDVTSSLDLWSQDPTSNRGWIFVPSNSQDVIEVSGSAIGNASRVTVDLQIDSPQRGELVVTLRHGDYTALLLNRIGRATCSHRNASFADDLNITLDQDAAQDVHFAPGSAPLTGTFRPDAFCVDLPLCTPGGTGGLCGQPVDGDWVLNVRDEWSGGGTEATLVSWGITLSDGTNPDETYSSAPGLVIPKSHSGNAWASKIASSEHRTLARRPKLEVTYRDPASSISMAPTEFSAYPQSGVHRITVSIPAGLNDNGPVMVWVISDSTQVAEPLDTPLTFPQGGPTSQEQEIAIGDAGVAHLATVSSGAIANAELLVTVSDSAIQLDPDTLFPAVGDPSETLTVTIPLGSNATNDVNLTVSSSDPSLVDIQGGTGGVLPLTFSAGSANSQMISLLFGASPGSTAITATDDGGLLASGGASVVLSEEPAIEYDVHIEPYLQPGDAPLGAASDQALLAWHTITRRRGGPNADRFLFEYRRLGDPGWISLPAPIPSPSGSASRLVHAVTVSGLDFDEDYEYRVTHLRNESPLPGGSYETSFHTRPTGPFRFTAFGNAGQGIPSQAAVAAQLELLNTDLHLLLGDFVYWRGEYEHYKPRVVDVYGTLMRSIPFLFTLGNHEALTEAGQSALDFFHVPENGPPVLTSEYYYSFDFGDAHFVSLNSGGAVSLNEIEMEVVPWLEADLAASTKTWKIVFTHEPPVTRDPFGIDRQETPWVRDYLLSAAVEQGADLFIAGAVHSMQRYLPITAVVPAEPFIEWAACEQGQGTTLIYPGTGSWVRSPPGPVPDPLPEPMELYGLFTGIGVFDIDGNTLTASMITSGGTVVDSVVLNKCLLPGDCECPVCGNGAVEGTEQCDDGNTDPGDGCSETCQLEGGP